MDKKIEFAPTQLVDQFRLETNEILRHIASMLKEPEDWLSYAFVSDESRIGDFFYEDSELVELRDRLGLPDIFMKSLICEIAAMLCGRKRPH